MMKRRIAKIPGVVFIILYCIINLLPVVWTIYLSFLPSKVILNNEISFAFTGDGYTYAFDMLPLSQYVLNSVVVSITVMVLNLVLVSMAAYVFSQHRFRGDKVLYGILMMAFFIPTSLMIGPIYFIIGRLGLLNTKWALIIVYVGLNMPTTLIIMKNSFDSISKDIIEAARIDGAENLRVLFQIMLPNVKASAAAAAAMCFISSWNEFTYALLLTTSNATRTIPVSVSYFIAQYSYNHTAMFAAVTVTMLPGILLMVLGYKYVFRTYE